MLGEIKLRIQQERLRVVLAANVAMVMLYWDIGRMILDRQERAGWGAKVIDRLAADCVQEALEQKIPTASSHESGRLTRVGPEKGGYWRVPQ